MLLTPELVARCFRAVPEPESGGYTDLTDAEIAAEAARLLAGAPMSDPEAGPDSAPGPWVFAYGSLIWKPVFTPVETARVRAHGWHRSFCIELTSWRGTPEAPGLMMALARGGSCTGIAMRLDPATAEADLVALVRREMPYRELLGNARWIAVDGPAGRHPALTFYASPVGERISQGLPLETVARRLALACGYAGSCAEYLYNTVEHLEAAGIRDRNLWTLQRLAATEILGWPPAA